MPLFLTLLCSFTSISQGIIKKQYSNRSNKGMFTFNAILSFAAMLFFAFLSLGDPYGWEALPYALAFGIAYATATIAEFIALSCGSLAITAMIMSYSLILPTLYGVCFWGETLGLRQYVGLAVLCVSLFLIRGQDTNDSEKKKQRLKWLLFAALAFVGNGGCTIFQHEQQLAFGNKYDNSYMVMALTFVFAVFSIIAILLERKDILPTLCKGGGFALLTGIGNGATNLLVMLILVSLPASVFFPVLSALSLVLSTLASVFLFKERLLLRQLIALLLGCVAVVLIN